MNNLTRVNGLHKIWPSAKFSQARSSSGDDPRHSGAIRVLVAVLAISPWIALGQPATTNQTSWKLTATAAIKETFDSNVYLQSETAKANQESLVTCLIPQVGVSWTPSAAFNATASYSPEATWFHTESSEDFLLHRGALKFAGKVDDLTYEWASSAVVIDGSSTSPTWTGLGGAPAAGGPAIRDRRDSAVYRSSLRLTQPVRDWLLRPVATLYVHDFQTDQRATAGYQNSVDRTEAVGGLDLGHRLAKLTAWIGYRYGMQNQARLLQFPEEYDNTFHRVLFGLEGSPLSWLKLNLSLGPEFRHYGNKVPVTFPDRNVLNLFIDSSLIVTPTKSDTITFSVKQFQQPGFGGRSTYDDLTYDLAWRHKLDNNWTAGLSGRAYNTDFLLPVVRNDWIYSGSLFLNWNISKQWNAEASYTYESGQSEIVNTPGREYTRHLVALGVKYSFN